MPWTSVGFDGTITEIQWAGMAGLLGNDYVAAGNGDCLVTAVPGARSVSVAAGSLYGDGVLSTNSGAETVAMTTPVNGQWYVIALRRTWATNTAALVAIAGATTTTTTPTAPPTSFPTLNTNKGVLTDQPIAWAWCNSANTTVVVYDIRLMPVKSLPPVVATQAERDAKFMTPTQGLQVWRNDLGAVETYYGLYNASTNPGGRDTAGWYTTNKKSGLVPVRPTTITAVSGSASINSVGIISFTNVTALELYNCFTSEFDNYKFLITAARNGTSSDTYMYARFGNTGSGFVNTPYIGGLNQIEAGYTSTQNITGGDGMYFARMFYEGTQVSGTIDVMQPFVTKLTHYTGQLKGYYSTIMTNWVSGSFNGTASFQNIKFFNSSASMSGTIQIFGYNDK